MIFGLPNNFSNEQSQLHLLPVAWDATASYRKGTHKGPEAILEASPQIDLFHEFFLKSYQKGIFFHEDFLKWTSELNSKISPQADKIIDYFDGLKQSEEQPTYPENLQEIQSEVNKASDLLNDKVYKASLELLKSGKSVGLVGGDHSCPYGLIKALREFHGDDSLGILHIDAHADLRKAYQGFNHSHASIIRNALDDFSNISVHAVGIRDFCEKEWDFYQNNAKAFLWTQNEISQNLLEGKSFKSLANKIISSLPEKVYVSFDIDGLNPFLCPQTGTPVPGGLEFHEAYYLIKALKEARKEIVGFDLCEVAPSNQSSLSEDWNAIVGCRVLYLLSALSLS